MYRKPVLKRLNYLALLVIPLLILSLVVSVKQSFATPSQDNTAATWTDTFAASAGSLSASSQAGINTADGAIELTTNNGSGTFVAPFYTSGTASSVVISPLVYGRWNSLNFNVTNTANTEVTVQVYKSDGTTLVPDTDLAGNSTGFSTSPVDLSTIPYSATTGSIILKATLTTSNTSETPRLNDWTVSWTKTNGVSSDPAPALGPWSTVNRNNRNTNQMDGTLAPAYTVAWANMETASSSVLTATGDVVTEKYRADANQPIIVQTLSKATGVAMNSLKLDDNATTELGPSIETATKDSTIYLRRNGPPSDPANTIKLIAIRNGQLLWSRHVNENSGYGGFLNIDNAGDILMKSSHGALSKLTSTGERTWLTSTSFWNWAGPVAVGADNTVYNKASDQRFNVITPLGVETVDVPLGSGGFGPGSPSVDSDGSVYVATGPNGGGCTGTWYLHKFSASGTELWRSLFPKTMATSGTAPTLDGNYIYMRSICTDEIFVYDKDGTLVKTIGPATALAGPNNASGVVVDSAQQFLHPTSNKTASLTKYDGAVPWNYSFADTAYVGYVPGWLPKGDANQWYASWGRGIVAFKPWTLSGFANPDGDYLRGETITFRAISSMLPTDPVTGETNKVQVVLQDGTALPLTYNGQDSSGNSTWSTTYTVPTNTALGTYSATLQATAANTTTSTPVQFAVAAAGSNGTGLSTSFTYNVVAPMPGLPATGQKAKSAPIGLMGTLAIITTGAWLTRRKIIARSLK